MDVVPLEPFGAELTGWVLGAGVLASTGAALRDLLARHQLLLIRSTQLTPADQLRVTRMFGTPEAGLSLRPQSHKVAGHRDVLLLSNVPGSATDDYGFSWHSDGLAYARVPHGATLLHCVACPPGVGATLFADQYAAYSALDASLQMRIADLYWHLPPMPFSEIAPGSGLAQPVVRMHPVTGRKFLFCAPAARQIRGKTLGDSAELLAAIRARQTLAELTYRHRWMPGDLVIWENCTLLHNREDVVRFASAGARVMHRTAVGGDFPALECEAPGASADGSAVS